WRRAADGVRHVPGTPGEPGTCLAPWHVPVTAASPLFAPLPRYCGYNGTRERRLHMKLRTQLVLPVLVIVTAFGALLGAQAKQPAAKAKKMRVYFVEPKNNANVTSPVHMKFAAEGIEISPVPPGDPKETRPGVAHYHVGIDQDCLPAGKNIVKGTPSWVHF